MATINCFAPLWTLKLIANFDLEGTVNYRTDRLRSNYLLALSGSAFNAHRVKWTIAAEW